MSKTIFPETHSSHSSAPTDVNAKQSPTNTLIGHTRSTDRGGGQDSGGAETINLVRPVHRIFFLDNLRTFMIFLVVLLHAGIVYESSGICAVFWIVDDPATNDLSGIVNVLLDVFVMPTIFFISGYFAVQSLTVKSGWQHIKSKFIRLVVPWIGAVLTLIPAYKYIFLSSRGLPQEHWTTYFHFSNGIFSQSWLWFLPVLFGINVVYLLLTKLKFTRVLGNMPVGVTVGVTFVLGFVNCIGMDLFGWQGWTKIGFVDFQNERLLLYVATFILGATCFQRKVFDRKPSSRWSFHLLNLLVWIPMMTYIVFLLSPLLNPGSSIVSPGADSVILWLSFMTTMLSAMYLMILAFWFYFDRRSAFWSELGKNSYGVYVIHVIVIGISATVMLSWEASSLLKYVSLTIVSFLACNILISLMRRMTAHIKSSRAAMRMGSVS